MVLEDEAGIREIAKCTRESSGYKAFTASDRPEGLAFFVESENEIRVMLTDVMIPHLDRVGPFAR